VPEYQVDESGPDHRKEFTATVVVAGKSYGAGDGRTKKEAEQKAAEAAYNELHEQLDTPEEEQPEPAPEATEEPPES
jgi:ribonuclease-3